MDMCSCTIKYYAQLYVDFGRQKHDFQLQTQHCAFSEREIGKQVVQCAVQKLPRVDQNDRASEAAMSRMTQLSSYTFRARSYSVRLKPFRDETAELAL